jgi:uncharacterized phage-associated protein
MPHSAKAIANAFLDIATRNQTTIDPMKLQKLVYYAHGWNLALTEQPLIDEYIEAWPYGPVIPSLYYEFKEFGAGPIGRKARDFDWNSEGMIVPALDSSADPFAPQLLQRIWEIFSGYSAMQLSEMTHIAGGPWDQARAENSAMRNVQISNEKIKAYFTAQSQESQQEAASVG